MAEPKQKWLQRAHVAEHEACHAVVAQKLGLPVAWVTIDPGCDEGLNFNAACKIPDELIDRKNQLFEICVSMAAPYHITDHLDTLLGSYAKLEYMLACEIAGRAGYSYESVFDTSRELVSEHWPEIVDLAQRLEREGKVEFDLAHA